MKTRLTILLATALVAGCGGGDDRTPPPVTHDLASTSCDDEIEASLRPGDEVTEATRIARYDWSVEGNTSRVDLRSGDATSLGTLETDLAIDFAPGSGRLRQWRVETRLREREETTASQSLRGRTMGDGRLWLEITHRTGSEELIQWAVVGDDREPDRMSIAVEADEGADPEAEGRVRMPDGRLLEVLEIIEGDEQRPSDAEITDWVDRRIGPVFSESDAWQRLVAVDGDLAFWQGADAHARRCLAERTDPTASDLVVQRQSACPDATHDSELRRTRQAQCSDVERIEEGLEFILTANSVMGHVGNGSAITAGLVATGVVASGPAIGAAFVGGTVASIIINNAVNDAVDNNRETIFEAAGTAGETVAGNDSGDEFSDFFGGSNGDPHFDSFDGEAFDFHGAGEYVLVEAVAGDPLIIQVRQEPAAGVCPDVAINTAAATRLEGRRIAVYTDRDEPLHIDGEPAELPGGTLALPDGGIVERIDDAPVYELRWPDGERLRLNARNSRLDVNVGLPDHRRGQVRGLLGDFNGDPDDDFRPRGGDPLASPIAWDDLYDEFGDSWRLEPDASLFDYADDESASDFVDEQFPLRPTTLEALPDEARSQAETTCSEADIDNDIAYEDCVIDVACTGDSSYVDSHDDRDPDSALDVAMPIFMDGWSEQSDTSAGTWEVAEDGRWVVQQDNGSPTFFVSSRAYHETTIRGTFRVEDNDDDFIGFVFGYRSPLADRDDEPNDFETFLLSWKASEQTSSGETGREGFALSHISGSIPDDQMSATFWGRQSSALQEILATRYGENLGWQARTDYPFELTYTADAIVVVIGGEEIFRIDASQVDAPFEPGRFGFYNQSQPDVHYGDFRAGDPEENPTASLEGLEFGVDRPGSTYEEFEMETADPRRCREVCLDDAACRAFSFQRAYQDGPDPACRLKDAVPDPTDDGGVISGVR